MHTLEDIAAWAEVVIEDIAREFPEYAWVEEALAVKVRRDRRTTSLRARAIIYGPGSPGIWLYHNTLKHDDPTLIENTVRHEVAHHIAYQEHEDAGHGKWWRWTAKKIGAMPKARTWDHEILAWVADRERER